MKNVKKQNSIQLESKVIESFKTIDVSKCKECEEYCRRWNLPLHGPLSFFNIGENFGHDQYGVVFVGKATWYNQNNVNEVSFLTPNIRDCRDGGTKMILERRSSYWKFIKKIAQQLYPEKNEAELLDYISITNLTKFNTSKSFHDETPLFLTKNCIDNIFEKENTALQPKHMIFLTGTHYDKYINRLKFGYATNKDRSTQTDKKENVKKESVWWWHRESIENGKVKMHFLRTRYPLFVPNENEFAIEIANWIKENETL